MFETFCRINVNSTESMLAQQGSREERVMVSYHWTSLSEILPYEEDSLNIFGTYLGRSLLLEVAKNNIIAREHHAKWVKDLEGFKEDQKTKIKEKTKRLIEADEMMKEFFAGRSSNEGKGS